MKITATLMSALFVRIVRDEPGQITKLEADTIIHNGKVVMTLMDGGIVYQKN